MYILLIWIITTTQFNTAIQVQHLTFTTLPRCETAQLFYKESAKKADIETVTVKCVPA